MRLERIFLGVLATPFFCMIESLPPTEVSIVSNDNPDKPSDIGRSIWLAGLGAYGKAIRDAQGKLEEAAREPPRLFRELVEKGSRLEDEVRDSLSSMRKTGGLSVEERIGRVRETFNLSLGRSDELDTINARLDALEEKLDALLSATGAGKPTRKAAASRKAAAGKKAPARRKAAAKQKAAVKKKAPARKKAAAKAAGAGRKTAAKKQASTARKKAPGKKR